MSGDPMWIICGSHMDRGLCVEPEDTFVLFYMLSPRSVCNTHITSTTARPSEP